MEFELITNHDDCSILMIDGEVVMDEHSIYIGHALKEIVKALKKKFPDDKFSEKTVSFEGDTDGLKIDEYVYNRGQEVWFKNMSLRMSVEMWLILYKLATGVEPYNHARGQMAALIERKLAEVKDGKLVITELGIKLHKMSTEKRNGT